MIREIKHIGLINPDHVVSVNAYRGRRYGVRVTRKYLFWGKPRRDLASLGSGFWPANVRVNLADGSTRHISCSSNASAERVRDEIIEGLNEVRA